MVQLIFALKLAIYVYIYTHTLHSLSISDVLCAFFSYSPISFFIIVASSLYRNKKKALSAWNVHPVDLDEPDVSVDMICSTDNEIAVQSEPVREKGENRARDHRSWWRGFKLMDLVAPNCKLMTFCIKGAAKATGYSCANNGSHTNPFSLPHNSSFTVLFGSILKKFTCLKGFKRKLIIFLWYYIYNLIIIEFSYFLVSHIIFVTKWWVWLEQGLGDGS